jgi:hypothetical protein
MERFPLEMPALLSTMDESGKQTSFEVTTRDICSGGAFFLTDHPLPLGTEVKMNLVLPIFNGSTDKEIKTKLDFSGWIVRTESKGAAVCFHGKYKQTQVTQ